jgi:hypothetical protein
MKGLLPLMRSVLFIFLPGVGILYHGWGESARYNVVIKTIRI